MATFSSFIYITQNILNYYHIPDNMNTTLLRLCILVSFFRDCQVTFFPSQKGNWFLAEKCHLQHLLHWCICCSPFASAPLAMVSSLPPWRNLTLTVKNWQLGLLKFPLFLPIMCFVILPKSHRDKFVALFNYRKTFLGRLLLLFIFLIRISKFPVLFSTS